MYLFLGVRGRVRYTYAPFESLALFQVLTWVALVLALYACFFHKEIWVPWQMLLAIGKAELCFLSLFMTERYAGWFVSTGFTRRRFQAYATIHLFMYSVLVSFVSSLVYGIGRFLVAYRFDVPLTDEAWRDICRDAALLGVGALILLFALACFFLAAGAMIYRWTVRPADRYLVIPVAILAALLPVPALGNADNLLLYDYLVVLDWIQGIDRNFYEMPGSPEYRLLELLQFIGGTNKATAWRPATFYLCCAAAIPVLAGVARLILRTTSIRSETVR